MKKLENILLVGGTGRNSGKTRLVTYIISMFSDIRPVAVKISPHFHEASAGLTILVDRRDYKIYRELSLSGDKDSSRMLVAGASEAYYIQVYDKKVGEAFSVLSEIIGPGRPIICESPALRQAVDPGVFIIADSDNIKDKKDLGWTYSKADIIFKLGNSYDYLDIKFSDGRWLVT